MMFNTTSNNISVLSVEEIGVPHQPAASHWQTLSHNVVSSTSRLGGIQTSVVIGTGYKGSCKSNYFTITITTPPTLRKSKPNIKCVSPIYRFNTTRIYFTCKNEKNKPFTCFVSNPTIKIKYREKRWKFLLNLLHLQWIA